MELRSKALDRLLEALSPALSAELDRVAQETGESLEQEFAIRLQNAVLDAESVVRKTAADELAQAVAQVTEAERNRVTEQLEKQFSEQLVETTNRLQSEAASERSRLQEQIEQWKTFADTQRQLAEASSQPEILSRFLRLAQSFANSVAVYVAKADGLALWKNRGKHAFPEIISQQTTDPESFFRPIMVRGKTVAAVSAAPPFKPEAMEFLASSLERAIEVFGLKLRSPIPKPVMTERTVAVSSPQGSAGDLSVDDQRAHADARRTARLLVSEIKLYHEEELESGRQNGDIYQRLQKEIDTGRDLYMHRVQSAVVASHDYFHEELVRILGGNDASRLGSAYPGPMNS